MAGVADPDSDAALSAANTSDATDGFAALELDPRLLATIAGLGYEEPTPIQRAAVPPLLAGRDLLAAAARMLRAGGEILGLRSADDLEPVPAAPPAERQTALFSATISPTITRIAKRHLRDPARIKVHAEKTTRDGVARVRQVAYVVRR